MSDLGKIAYMAYREKVNGVSVISGETLPEWELVNPTIQAAWDAAANAVLIDYAEQSRAENKPS